MQDGDVGRRRQLQASHHLAPPRVRSLWCVPGATISEDPVGAEEKGMEAVSSTGGQGHRQRWQRGMADLRGRRGWG